MTMKSEPQTTVLGSSIWTTEPHAARALAAEIRHNPAASAKFFSKLLDADVGNLEQVALEKRKSRVDIILAFSKLRVGIEAKIGHEITAEQLDRQSESSNRQVLLVVELGDIPSEILSSIARTTWDEILTVFSESRLTTGDIRTLATSTAFRRSARTTFDRLALEFRSSDTVDGWVYSSKGSNSGYPSLNIEGPAIDLLDGRCLFGQIELPRTASSTAEQSVAYTATVGLWIERDRDLDLLKSDAPPWVRAMKVLRDNRDDLCKDLVLNTWSTPRTKEGIERPAAQIAQRHGLSLMYAKGYQDSYLGVKFKASTDPESYARDVVDFLHRFHETLSGSL